MSKYQSLSNRLAAHSGDEWRASFTEIEETLGFPLPKAARSGGAWWSKAADKPHSRAWAALGWEVIEVDPAAQAVLFRRPVSEAELQGGIEDFQPFIPGLPPVQAEPARSPKWPLKMRLASEGASLLTRSRGWRIAAAVAAGAAVAGAIGAIAMGRAARRRSADV